MTQHLTKSIHTFSVDNYLDDSLKERLDVSVHSTTGRHQHFDFPYGEAAIGNHNFREFIEVVERITGLKINATGRGL